MKVAVLAGDQVGIAVERVVASLVWEGEAVAAWAVGTRRNNPPGSRSAKLYTPPPAVTVLVTYPPCARVELNGHAVEARLTPVLKAVGIQVVPDTIANAGPGVHPGVDREVGLAGEDREAAVSPVAGSTSLSAVSSVPTSRGLAFVPGWRNLRK